MSIFLGAIHYWLYNKIKLQQSLVEEILRVAELKGDHEIRKSCYEQYGKPLEGNLEDIINTENIHGWLQDCITVVEYKLAYVTTELTHKGILSLSEIEEIFEKSGKDCFEKLGKEDLTPEETYRGICDYLLEGMPCDRINEIVEVHSYEVVWKRVRCIHTAFWNEVGGNVEYYYLLRDAWIKGFLAKMNLRYERMSNGLQNIRK